MNQIYAVASLLNTDTSSLQRSVWSFLAAQCEIPEIETMPFPHFSWQIAEAYQLEETKAYLSDLGKRLSGFTISACGLGIFKITTPVLYISLVKTRELMDIHSSLWLGLENKSRSASLNYSPERWVPHITLAYGKKTPLSKIVCTIRDFSFVPLNFEVRVDNISIIYQIEDEVGIAEKINI